MAEKKVEEQTKGDANQVAETPAPKKSGLMMYIIIGVGGMVLVTTIVVGVLMFTKAKPAETSATTDSSDSTAVEVAATDHKEQSHSKSSKKPNKSEQSQAGDLTEEDLAALDSTFALDSHSVLKEVADNLAFLDYKPGENEVAGGESLPMSANDSLEALDWLTKEETRLAKKEADLTQREAQVNKLNAEVSKKIIRLEQAETSRIGILAKMYDGMDPKAVAKLMADLDDETIVSILPRMKTNNASSVLGTLPSPRAAKLSKQMITIADGDTK
ncbi:MAG: hypothetical protein AAB305_04740 [Candidatus Zixiibacteriota bacterium]